MSQDEPDLQEMVQIALVNAEVAQLIYATRTQAGLTQQDLADLIGIQQPIIAQLEDADYAEHSLSMLQRIAQVLNRRVEITLVPLEDDAAELAKH